MALLQRVGGTFPKGELGWISFHMYFPPFSKGGVGGICGIIMEV